MPPRAEFKRISVEVARELVARPGVQLIDVRDAASFARARIPSACHVTSRNLSEVLLVLRKDRPVLIYCYHGNASQTYAQTFVDFGFREVYSMDGGFERWQQLTAAQSAEPGRSDARA
jgi:rhodanese-related sulfurtransferase